MELRSQATQESGQTALNQPLTAHCIVNYVKVCQDISDVLSIVLMNYYQNKRHIRKPWWHYLPNCSCRREVAVPFAVHHRNFEPPTGTGTGCNRPVSRWEPFCRAWLSSRFCRLHSGSTVRQVASALGDSQLHWPVLFPNRSLSFHNRKNLIDARNDLLRPATRPVNLDLIHFGRGPQSEMKTLVGEEPQLPPLMTSARWRIPLAVRKTLAPMASRGLLAPPTNLSASQWLLFFTTLRSRVGAESMLFKTTST